MDLESIAQRLRERASMLRAVGGSASLDAAYKANRFPEPSAYVLPARHSAGKNELGSNGFSQLVSAEFAVVLCVKNVADARGSAAHGDLQPVLEEVYAVLLNWQPPWAANPIEMDSGKLADVEPGLLWWEEVFRVEFYKNVEVS